MTGTLLRGEQASPAYLDVHTRAPGGELMVRTMEFETAEAAWAFVDEMRANPRAIVMFSRRAET